MPAGAPALVFAGIALHQGALLYDGALPGWEPSPASLAQVVLLAATVAGLTALRTLRRITGERDRAEDLHWDSMESVRVMSELAARPGAELSDKLRTVLELGVTRFGLELGVAWCEGGGGDGEVIGLRTPGSGPLQPDTLEGLLPGLRELMRTQRPQLIVRRDGGGPPTLFGVGVVLEGRPHGTLAFAGTREREDRFTATDKDVLGLMAQWLSTELERRAHAAAPAPQPAPATAARAALAPLRPRRGRDLNAAVRRAEHGLRRRVGVEASLELSLDPKLPQVRAGRLSLSTLVESLVHGAARLAPTGRIHLETRQSGGGESEDLMLQVSVKGDAIDAGAFERLFVEEPAPELPQGSLPIARLERLLRRDGGDLSVAVEPGHSAVLSAYLPAQTAAAGTTAASVQPSR